jgi:very-short-patch-repair endonuclease
MVLRERNTIRGTTTGVTTSSRHLRGSMTPAEHTLWQALQRRQLHGLRFRAQHPVGSFILDFYCPSHKLVIEVDGTVHDRQREQDQARTEHLEAYGYTVLRFSNDEVLTDVASVLERIAEAASALGAPPRPPNPGGRQPSARHRLSDQAQNCEDLSPPRIGGPGGRA